ncbi:MAG: hypothetical protein ACTHWZ_01390 [Peptoniphilaceae bacterium]
MKVKAYTYIVTIIIISFLLVIVTGLLSSFSNNSFIYSKELDSIQSECYAESVLNIAINDKKFVENIKNLFFSKQDKWDLNINPNIENLSVEKLQLRKENKKIKSGFSLETIIKYKDIEEDCYAYGSMINEIYTKKLGVINSRVVDKEDIDKLKNFFNNENIENTDKIKEIILDDKNYYIKNEGIYNMIYTEVEKENINDENIEKIEVARFNRSNSVYIKQDSGNLVFENKILLRGILDVSNIYLNESANLKGILFLRRPIEYIENRKTLEVSGITLNPEDISENNLISNYNYLEIEKYGRYLKNFIDPKILSIQSSRFHN